MLKSIEKQILTQAKENLSCSIMPYAFACTALAQPKAAYLFWQRKAHAACLMGDKVHFTHAALGPGKI